MDTGKARDLNIPNISVAKADTRNGVHVLRTLEQDVKVVPVTVVDAYVVVILAGQFLDLSKMWIASPEDLCRDPFG